MRFTLLCYLVARVTTVRAVTVRNVSARAIAAGSVCDVYLVHLTSTIVCQNLVSVTYYDR